MTARTYLSRVDCSFVRSSPSLRRLCKQKQLLTSSVIGCYLTASSDGEKRWTEEGKKMRRTIEIFLPLSLSLVCIRLAVFSDVNFEKTIYLLSRQTFTFICDEFPSFDDDNIVINNNSHYIQSKWTTFTNSSFNSLSRISFRSLFYNQSISSLGSFYWRDDLRRRSALRMSSTHSSCCFALFSCNVLL